MTNFGLPRNLVVKEDGSVYARDFTKDIVAFEWETLTEYQERFKKETEHLKDYELHMVIPEEQLEKLYKVIITFIEAKPTINNEDSWFEEEPLLERLFINKESAIKFARNKIKQQSVACYHSKYNPYKKQYKYKYVIIHKTDDIITESAISGKII